MTTDPTMQRMEIIPGQSCEVSLSMCMCGSDEVESAERTKILVTTVLLVLTIFWSIFFVGMKTRAVGRAYDLVCNPDRGEDLEPLEWDNGALQDSDDLNLLAKALRMDFEPPLPFFDSLEDDGVNEDHSDTDEEGDL